MEIVNFLEKKEVNRFSDFSAIEFLAGIFCQDFGQGFFARILGQGFFSRIFWP